MGDGRRYRALSIVRYRTAVKDPLDLLYLFWAITTGITAGAGMYALVGGSVEKVGVEPDPKRAGPASWNLEHA